MQNENFINTRDLLGALAEAMNFINPDIENHHQQTAYLAYMLARHLGLCSKSIEQTVYAGLLHDVGSVVLEGRKTVLEIESDVRTLSTIGAGMIRDISELDGIADIIELLKISEKCDKTVCDTQRIASLIHLSDTVSLMLKHDEPVLTQIKCIKEHPYNTRLVLMPIQGFGKIADWAGYHHEKLNGNGYPFYFGADVLDTGSRILAVADIFPQ